jgi:phosphoglycerol transferase MdoB-like AlkP superfamily enzyme
LSRLSKSLGLVALGAGIFGLARLALLLLYPASFADLSGGAVVAAFANGLRFDASVLLSVLALPLVMMNLPVRALGKGWFDAWAWLGFVLLVPLGLILGGDVAYYAYGERHLSDELFVISGDLDFLVEEALGMYLPALLGVAGLALGLGWLWRCVLALPMAPARHPLAGLLVLVSLLVLATRGTLDRKPLGLIDAYRDGSTAFGNLSLNGVFSTVHTLRSTRSRADRELVAAPEAYARLGLEDEPYPLLRRIDVSGATGRNVVVLLFESWDPRYLDSYDGAGGGITPNFDRLAAQGLRYDRCYAASHRSVDAIQALLTGVPPIVGEPSLGWGLRLARVTQLGDIAGRRGYETLFVQSSKRRSYRLDSAARSLGFEHFYGQQDVPIRLDYPDEPPKWGWDYDTLMFSLERLDEFEAPFLAFVFGGSTHVPYRDPGERFHLRTHSASGEGGFVNLLHYSDWALGEFMDAARRRPWFDETVFLITSDHTSRQAPRSDDLRSRFRIPLLLYAPGFIEPGVDTTVCSHLDGLPTLLELLGFDDAYATFGQSLLHERDGYAVVKQGNVMGIIDDEGSLLHSLEGRLEAEAHSGASADLDALEHRLLSFVAVTHRLLRTNRWVPAR